MIGLGSDKKGFKHKVTEGFMIVSQFFHSIWRLLPPGCTLDILELLVLSTFNTVRKENRTNLWETLVFPMLMLPFLDTIRFFKRSWCGSMLKNFLPEKNILFWTRAKVRLNTKLNTKLRVSNINRTRLSVLFWAGLRDPVEGSPSLKNLPPCDDLGLCGIV